MSACAIWGFPILRFLFPVPAVVGSLRIYRPHISSGVGGSLHRYWGGGRVPGGGDSILFPLYAEVHLR